MTLYLLLKIISLLSELWKKLLFMQKAILFLQIENIDGQYFLLLKERLRSH